MRTLPSPLRSVSVLLVGLFILLIVVGPRPAMAKYLVISASANRVEYVELYTARRTVVGYVVVLVEDYFNPDLMGNLSRMTLKEVDCQKGQMRTRLERRYTGKRGTGRVSQVVRQPEGNWQKLSAIPKGKFLQAQFCTQTPAQN